MTTVNPTKKNKFLTELYEWAESICISLAVVLFLFSFCFKTVEVWGPSMEDTLQGKDPSGYVETVGDRLLISNLFYTPQANDIVVIDTDTEEGAIIKRIIATEGQTVDIDFSTGSVYVDGVLLKEDYINELTFLEEGTEFPLTVPKGSVFVMGDNRNHSSDSRDSRLGTVDTRYVIGKAVFLAFPGPDQYSGERNYGRIGAIE